jgi:hypothetical protein
VTDNGDTTSARVLQSSRRRTVGLLILSAVFAVAGVLMVGADADFGWLVAAFGLVGTVVFVIMLLRPNRLELSEEGFTAVTLGRRWTVKWSECGEFRPSKVDFNIGSPAMVVFHCNAPSVRGHVLEAAAEALSGANAALPETYGMPAGELAALLNTYREARRGTGAA